MCTLNSDLRKIRLGTHLPERNYLVGTGVFVVLCTVLYCGRVPAASAPGCTAAEGLLYKPWSLFVPPCLHQRP